jgi:hypothetical protein
VTDELERDGVEAFRDSYRQLLGCIETRIGELRAGRPAAGAAQVAAR